MAKIRNKILICLLCLTAIVFGFSAIYTFYNGTVANAETNSSKIYTHNNGIEVNNESGFQFYFKTDAINNALHGNGDWNVEYGATSVDNIKLTRGGETTSVAIVGQGTIVRINEIDHYMKFAGHTVSGVLPVQEGDVFTISGTFKCTSDANQMFNITETTVTYTNGALVYSTDPVVHNAGKMTAHPSGVNLDENGGGASGFAFYFKTDANDALHGNGAWNIEYGATSADNIKLTRGGETTSVATIGQGTIVRYGETDHYMKFVPWTVSNVLPVQEGDVFTISGTFKCTSDANQMFNITETTVTYTNGALVYSTDPVVHNAGKMTAHPSGVNLDENGGGASGFAFYFKTDANDALHGNGAWNIEYGATSADNIKLTRGGETTSVATIGQGTIVRYGETDHYMKFVPWTVSNVLPVQEGDVFTISGTFKCTSDETQMFNITETTVTYIGGGLIFGDFATVTQEGISSHEGTAKSGMYFRTTGNSAPYNGDWSLRYKPTSASAIQLIRGETTTNVGNTGAETIVKINEYDYFLEGWAIGAKIDEQTYGWQVGDIYVLNGAFYNTANEYTIRFVDVRLEITAVTDGVPTVEKYEEIVEEPAIEAGQMFPHSNVGDVAGVYFTMTENSAPYGAWGSYCYDATSLDCIKLTRNGVTHSVGLVGRQTILKLDATTYYLRLEEYTIGEYAPYQEGDVFTIGGIFLLNGGNIKIDVAETQIEYFRGKFYFSTSETLIKASKMQVHPEHGGSSGGFYFTMSANDAPYEGWSLRYTPTSSENVKRIRGGETTNVGNTSAETIVKYSDTEYYCEGWPFGGIEEGDVFIFEGDFKNTAHNVIINIERTVIRYSNGKITIIEEELSMVEGAAIRFVGDGLRFIANLGVNPDMDAKYYVMIVPEYYLTMLNITENYYDNLRNALGQDAFIANMEAEPFQSEDDETLTSGLWYVQGSLVNILPENLNTEFFGIAYMVKDGVTTYATFTEGTNVRSIVEVSSLALNNQSAYSDSEITSLKNIVQKTTGDVTNLAINSSQINYMQGYPISERLTLGLPEGADVVVKWESSAPDVIAVDELGNVIGLKTGSATITATCMGKTYTCEVTNQAGARPKDLAVKGNVLTWSSLANLERYKVTVNGNSYEVNDTVFDLEDLGLAVGTEYEISVCGIVNGVDTNSTKIDVTYYNYNDNNYVGALQGEKELPVGVWNGSIHFTHNEKLQMLEDLADVGITLVIGVNPVWFGDLDSLITVLDKAYELGISFIVDVRDYVSDGGYYAIWDGSISSAQKDGPDSRPYTRKDYLTHPAITQVLLWDEPYEYVSGDMADKYGPNGLAPSKLRGIESKFEGEKGSIGRNDMSLYTNLLPATAIAGIKGDTDTDYASNYVDKYLDKTGGLQYYQDISVDDYPLLTKDGWLGIFSDKAYIRKGYYYGLETLATKARDYEKNFHLTILSSKHGDTSGTYYNLPDANVLRWQMAVGMAFGVTNLTHYTLGTHATDYEAIYMKNGDGWAKHSTLFNDVSTVNNEYLAWDEIYRNYKWQGYSTVDKGGNNSMLKVLTQKGTLPDNGLSSATIGTSSRAVLIGKFKDASENSAFMITNAGYTTDNNSGKFYNISYSMNDARVTLTFDSGYVGAWVINRGVKTYNPLSNNQLTVDVKAWDGVFVIPVKAKGAQLATATIDGFDKATSSVVWNSVENASAYEVVITRDGKTLVDTIVFDSQKDGSGKLSVALNDLVFGEYTVKITARNDGLFAKGKTAESKFTLGLKQN